MILRYSLLSLVLIGSAGTAAAGAPDFCTDSSQCVKVYVFNAAAATVTSVKIKQQSGPNNCESGEEKKITGNLSGGALGMPGDDSWFTVDPRCKYKIVFKTTSGCTGDKTTHFYPDDLVKENFGARLTGYCGTLKTKTGTVS